MKRFNSSGRKISTTLNATSSISGAHSEIFSTRAFLLWLAFCLPNDLMIKSTVECRGNGKSFWLQMLRLRNWRKWRSDDDSTSSGGILVCSLAPPNPRHCPTRVESSVDAFSPLFSHGQLCPIYIYIPLLLPHPNQIYGIERARA